MPPKPSEEELGKSNGVLAPEDPSASEPGVGGLLSMSSSGAGDTEESGVSDIVGNGDGQRLVPRKVEKWATEQAATCGRSDCWIGGLGR